MDGEQVRVLILFGIMGAALVVGLVWVVRDISNRRAHEQRQRERLRAARRDS